MADGNVLLPLARSWRLHGTASPVEANVAARASADLDEVAPTAQPPYGDLDGVAPLVPEPARLPTAALQMQKEDVEDLDECVQP